MTNPTMIALHAIQTKLNAPKNQYNEFAKFKYRSLEDICAAIKPLLVETNSVFWMSDDVTQVGDRIYVTSTANLCSLKDGAETISARSFAREPLSKKGNDDAQVTGATSSYARKYAANALFCIDDIKDPDALPPTDQQQTKKPDKTKEQAYSKLLDSINGLETADGVRGFMKDNAAHIKKQLGGSEYLDLFRQDCNDRIADLTEA